MVEQDRAAGRFPRPIRLGRTAATYRRAVWDDMPAYAENCTFGTTATRTDDVLSL